VQQVFPEPELHSTRSSRRADRSVDCDTALRVRHRPKVAHMTVSADPDGRRRGHRVFVRVGEPFVELGGAPADLRVRALSHLELLTFSQARGAVGLRGRWTFTTWSSRPGFKVVRVRLDPTLAVSQAAMARQGRYQIGVAPRRSTWLLATVPHVSTNATICSSVMSVQAANALTHAGSGWACHLRQS
jgi:hypothetical protein